MATEHELRRTSMPLTSTKNESRAVPRFDPTDSSPSPSPLFLALPAGAASAQTADTVLFNGKVLTVDKDFSTQQAHRDRAWRGAGDRDLG